MIRSVFSSQHLFAQPEELLITTKYLLFFPLVKSEKKTITVKMKVLGILGEGVCKQSF